MRTKTRRVCLSLLLALPVLGAVVSQASDTENFRQLLEDDWEFSLRESPLWATRTGDHRFNDQLSRETLDDQQRRIAQRKEFRERLLELPRRVPLKTVEDYENYLSRLKQFERYADDHIQLMRAGMKEGYTLPSVVMEGFREPIQAHIVSDPTKSKLYEPFNKLPVWMKEDVRRRLRAESKQAITNGVVPGYEKFLRFMADEYVPACRGSIGASALPDGRAFYRHRVRQYTTLDLSPQEVHDTGLREVKRIGGEMDALVKASGFEGDRKQFVEFLRTDEQFYASDKQQLLNETAFVLKKIDGQLPRLFQTSCLTLQRRNLPAEAFDASRKLRRIFARGRRPTSLPRLPGSAPRRGP